MKNYKRITSFLLALAIVLTSFAPSIMQASAIEIENDANEDEGLEIEGQENLGDGELSETQKLEIATVRSDLLKAQKSVEDIEAPDEKYEEILEKYDEAAVSLDGEIDRYEEEAIQRASMPRQGGSSIYDLTTIPVRVQLLIRIGRAIRFGSTELSNKVVAAHTKLTEYILVGILYTVNPFASEGQIMEYIEGFEALEQELLAYPDLTPEDIATIYKKAAYHRTIAWARKVRNKANRTGRKFQAKQLNKVISDSAALWWRITVTCGELDEQEAKLIEAIEAVEGPLVKVESVEFMEGNKGAINLDKKTKLSPVILPAEVKNKDVVITSSNPFIARVVGGEIIPIKPGSIKIVATSIQNGVTGEFELTILNPGEHSSLPMLEPTADNDAYLTENGGGGGSIGPVYDEKAEVQDISFTRESARLEIGQEFDLAAKTMVFPERAVDKSLSYRSEDPAIVEVNEEGLVTAISPGQTNIVVSSVNGVEKSFPVEAFDKEEDPIYEITEVIPSERKAGVFTISIKATKNGKPYTGPTKLSLTGGDKTVNETVYLDRGEGEVTFTGFTFGVWNKDFTGQVTLADQVKEFEMTYK